MNRSSIITTAAASVAIGLVTTQVNAATLLWKGGGGALSDANYTTDGTDTVAPAAGDTLNIGGGSTLTQSTDLSIVSGDMNVDGRLRVGHAIGTPSGLNGAGNLTVTNGAVISLGGTSGVGDNIGLIVGSNHNGTMTIEDGASVTSARQVGVGIGNNASRTGTLDVTTGGSLTITDGNFSIATRSSNNAGTSNAGNVSMSGETSSINVVGGGADLNIGIRQGTGTYSQTDGTLSVTDVIEVGHNTGASTGSSFTISGGTAGNGGNFFVGRGNSVNASLTVEGGTLNVGNRLLIGGSGDGATGSVVHHSAGTVNTVLDIRVGDASGDASFTSTYNLSGSGIINATTGGIVGRQGTAAFNQTGGTANWNGGFSIGNKETATGGTSGIYTISAGDANFNTSLSIAPKGTGELRVIGDDATLDVTNNLTVGNTVDGTGTLAFELETGDLLSIINVGGTATFADGAQLVFDATNAGPTQTVYNLLTAATITDNGISFSQIGTSGWTYQIIPGGNGQILQVVVPEPASLGLAAMAGLLFLRRRRQS